MKLSTLSSIAIRGIVPAILVPLLAYPSGLVAQTHVAQTRDTAARTPDDGDHIVTTQALDNQVQLSASERAQDVATVTAFLSTPIAERTMHDARVDAVQVRTAIPTLSDRELKDLATRSADAQQKFAAGGLTSLALTLIILGVIIIIVVAIVH
jgi:hypothetical protein